MAQANNMIMIVGRVGAEPEMKYIDSNKVVARFNVAVNRPTKDQNGNYITDWFSCEFWNKQAEIAGEYIKKGTLISVTGSGRIDKWEDKNTNEKKSRFFIHGDNFQLLSAKGEGGGYESGGSSSSSSASGTSKGAADDFDLEDDIPPF